MLKRTPLYEAHCRLGARMVEFGGWEMPLLYRGIVEEHLAVRQAAGVFDISHMGNFTVAGPGAGAFLNHCLTNDLDRLAVGQGQYTLMCNERGGVVDDLYVFRVKPDEYLLVVNAARTRADWEWLDALVDAAPTGDGFNLRDDTDRLAALALQGPRAAEILPRVIEGGSIAGMLVAGVAELKKNQWAGFVFRGHPVGVARTGYTGEDGFELVLPAGLAEEFWTLLLAAGKACALQPAGLGARDTLRTEMGYPLYGHELSEDITPLEAGLQRFVALSKGDFVGRNALLAQAEEGLRRRLVGFRMEGRTPPPRPGMEVQDTGGRVIGRVTSGTQSPSLGTGIGMALIAAAEAVEGRPIRVVMRGRAHPAVIVRRPILSRPKPGSGGASNDSALSASKAG
ncbi:MAG: glycine cleavage system aminomethyltransferase GcvT [Verrucomicrobia bacterium]|nr:MAG: glycine cleavage system aminomethyltransferase GcvT [Verrucomicrobiota bacterium]